MVLPLSYNWRNIFVRKLSTALTVAVVAVVVFVLAVLLSFAAGIRAALASGAARNNVLVLAKGATAESTSIILSDEAGRLVQTPGVLRNERGIPLISEEIVVQTNVPRRGDNAVPAAIGVRGVDDIALEVHNEVTLVEGRMFRQGTHEVIVGQAARKRFADLQVGSELLLGRQTDRAFRVVGIFSAAGGALESEVWAPRTMVSDVYARRLISSALLRIADPSGVQPAIDYISGPTVNLAAKTETEYYDDLSSKTQEIVTLTTVLVGLMAVGAVFAVANTMYAAVDRRRQEIAMLRTLGFEKNSIILAFLLESVLLCVPAAGLGLLGSMAFSGRGQDFLSDTTWTVLAYEMRMTPGIIAGALLLALFLGILGALAPALRAARIPVIEALRKA